MSTEPNGVICEGLRKAFGAQTVLDGIDLVAPAGRILALLGVNGAGKTTTVSILATLLKPDAGRALVAGFDVVRQPAQVRRAISLTGQSTSLDPVLTGRENLTLIARLRHLPQPKRLAAETIERFGLAEAADRPGATYSGGMRRRLDLAMSLIARPAVVFLDEPTTGLDPAGRLEIWAAIGDFARQGATVVLTTQHMEEAARLADTIAVLHGGAIVACGDETEVRRAAGDAPDLEAAFLALTSTGALR
jgi:ABC-2 type transport system ATP-binding protein